MPAFRENPLLFPVFGLTFVIVVHIVWLLSYCKYSFIHTASWKGHQITFIFSIVPLSSCTLSKVMLVLLETFMESPFRITFTTPITFLSRPLIPSNLCPFKVIFNAGKARSYREPTVLNKQGLPIQQ
jgi:hypothetical protein